MRERSILVKQTRLWGGYDVVGRVKAEDKICLPALHQILLTAAVDKVK